MGKTVAEPSGGGKPAQLISLHCSKCDRETIHVFERELPDGGRLYKCFWCSSLVTRH